MSHSTTLRGLPTRALMHRPVRSAVQSAVQAPTHRPASTVCALPAGTTAAAGAVERRRPTLTP